ncbi:MAG: radical SAM protein [Patescibacteria group bacterium]
MQWELTPWCTYNCVHCYNYWRRGKRPKRTLSAKQLEVHNKSAQEIINSKVFHVTLTGGEPLGVLEQLMPELLALKDAGVRISINTNLALMNKRMISLLRQLGIRAILTSLMSADPTLNDNIAQTKGAYRRTVAGIRLAIANGFRVSVNMVISQKNFHTIYETGKLAYELGAQAFCATKVSKPFNCKDFSGYSLLTQQIQQMFRELVRLKRDFGIQVASLEPYPACLFPDDETRAEFGDRHCSAARTSCTLGFDGAIRPCSHAPISYGNAIEIGLLGAWQNMGMWRDGSLIPAACAVECREYPKFCSAGCRIESLNAGTNLSGSDPYCLGSKPVAQRFVAKPELFPASAVIRLLSSVRFRKEDFGYIAYRSSANWQAIDSTLHAILKSTLNEKGVTAKQIAQAYNATESDALETMSILITRHIVEQV